MIIFLILSSRNPGRSLKEFSRPSTIPTGHRLKCYHFHRIDTKDVRAPDSKAYAILNDKEHKSTEEVSTALENYGVFPLMWSKREKYVAELVA